jgi:hypothetical protein
VPTVDALTARLERAWRAACAQETVEDLVAESPAEPLLVTGDGHVLNQYGPRM